MDNPLKAARIRAGLSQAAVARRCKLTQSAISKYENGDATPSLKKAAKLASVLRISELEILYPERFRKAA